MINSSQPHFRAFTFRSFCLVLGVLIGFVVTESLLRCTIFATLIEYDHPSIFPRFFLQSDRLTGFDIAPNRPFTLFSIDGGRHIAIRSNELGCFQEPMEQLLANRKDYVLFAGGSDTFGFVSEWQNLAFLTSQALDVPVVNGGVPGFSMAASRVKMEKIVSVLGAPSHAVVLLSIEDVMNDFLFPHGTVLEGYQMSDVEVEGEGQTIRRLDRAQLRQRLTVFFQSRRIKYHRFPPLAAMKFWLRRHLVLYNLLPFPRGSWSLALRDSRVVQLLFKRTLSQGERDDDSLGRLRRFHARKAGLPLPVIPYAPLMQAEWVEQAWKAHFERIHSLATYLEERHIPVLFVLLPYKYQVYKFLPDGRFRSVADRDTYTKRLRRFLEQRAYAYLDLFPLFTQKANMAYRENLDSDKDFFYANGRRLSPKGHQVVARAIVKILKRRIGKLSE